MTYSMLQIDALKELGNIGSGNAATSLSTLLNTMVDLEITQVEILPIEKCIELLDIPSDQTYSIIHGLEGQLKGMFWFVMALEDRKFICEVVAGDLGVEHNLVMEEVTNILGGNYLSALSDMLNLAVELTPPEEIAAQDYLAKHTDHEIDTQNILFIKNALTVKDKTIHCFINLVLDKPSLQKLLEIFGL